MVTDCNLNNCMHFYVGSRRRGVLLRKRRGRAWRRHWVTPGQQLLCNAIYGSPARSKLPSTRRGIAVSVGRTTTRQVTPRVLLTLALFYVGAMYISRSESKEGMILNTLAVPPRRIRSVHAALLRVNGKSVHLRFSLYMFSIACAAEKRFARHRHRTKYQQVHFIIEIDDQIYRVFTSGSLKVRGRGGRTNVARH